MLISGSMIHYCAQPKSWRHCNQPVLRWPDFPNADMFPRNDSLHYREIVHGPWRMIYQMGGGDVLVHAILDGRRDIQNLLAHRLMRP